jgi:1-acyl-sn-glycerol-3-phosphate acyltransferase
MWHRYFQRFCGRFFFSAIRVRGAERIPTSAPVLWLGLHRNGAVDGFVYAAALRRPLVFMISTQLRKNFLARIFFNGIAVARTNDEGDRAANRAALGECIALLKGGGDLFIFPEGTSSLGPRHLPFKAGAAQLVLDWIEAGNLPTGLRVIPVGIHYECAWAFRSAVEVVIGDPIDIALPEGMAALGRLRELKRRMAVALEAVGANFAGAAAQHEAEAMANLVATASDATSSRFAMLKHCERGECAAALADWRIFDRAATSVGTRCHHGISIVPDGSGLRELVGLISLGLVVLAGILANAPPWFAARWAAKKFPDDINVIALWKILVGVPLLALWAAIVVLTLAITGGWLWVGGYFAVTGLAWACYDGVQRNAVAFWNSRFRETLIDPFRRVIAHWSPANDRDR